MGFPRVKGGGGCKQQARVTTEKKRKQMNVSHRNFAACGGVINAGKDEPRDWDRGFGEREKGFCECVLNLDTQCSPLKKVIKRGTAVWNLFLYSCWDFFFIMYGKKK